MSTRRPSSLAYPFFFTTALLAAGSLAVAACSSDDSTPPNPVIDAGHDANTPDTGTDARHDDGGLDAQPDVTPDATPDAPVDSPVDAPPDAPGPDCGAIVLLPALITVESQGGGALTCDATFALVDADGGVEPGSLGATLCSGSSPTFGCPDPDGAASCTYALLALQTTAPVSVQVSEPGYASAVATGVSSGQGGCANHPPTDSVVQLTPSTADSGTH